MRDRERYINRARVPPDRIERQLADFPNEIQCREPWQVPFDDQHQCGAVPKPWLGRYGAHFPDAFPNISALMASTSLDQWLLIYASTAQISPSLSLPAKAGMSLSYPGVAYGGTRPFLMIATSTSSAWCQVWPLSSCGGAGNRPFGSRLFQFA